MSRHQASRRRAYGRRQHELYERRQRSEADFDEPELPERGAGGETQPPDELPGLHLGDLFFGQGWRWAGGRS